MPSNNNEDKVEVVDDIIDNNSDSHSDTVTDTTGYSSDEDLNMSSSGSFSVRNPMIVVSNRLPFVLKRIENGELVRKSR